MKWLYFALALALSILPAPRVLAEYEIANGIAAVANESIITVHEVRRNSAPALDSLQRTFYNNPEQLRIKSDAAISDALEQLLERQLILHDFKTAGGSLPDNIIDDEINERIRQRWGDRITLTKNLQAEGLTREAYRQQTRDEIVLSYMDRKNVREALLISPAKIERYYSENIKRFNLGDQIKLRMITLNRPPDASPDDTRDLALVIRSKISEGTPFAEMASTYSDGSQRKEGGLMGWVQESALSPLSKIGLGLPTNQCSHVISMGRDADDSYWIYEYDEKGALFKGRKFTDRDALIEEKQFDGLAGHGILAVVPQVFYLLAVDEKLVAHTKALDEVRDEIERELLVQERNRLRKKWTDRLKAKSFVRFF
jgi:peptidyl-prolyl cis-trans isomerase SurA